MELKSEINKTSEKVEILDIEQEKTSHSIWLEMNSFRIALISTFTALAIVLGYLLALIVNIELFTLTIFLSGFILGKRDGMIVGFLSSFIFCFFNPLGASPLPLLTYQLFHYAMVGVSGGIMSAFLNDKKFFKPNEDLYTFKVMIILGIIGALITFSYDILSTLVSGFTVSFTIKYFITSYIFGIPFTTIHLIGNTLGFIFILPGLIQLIRKMLY